MNSLQKLTFVSFFFLFHLPTKNNSCTGMFYCRLFIFDSCNSSKRLTSLHSILHKINTKNTSEESEDRMEGEVPRFFHFSAQSSRHTEQKKSKFQRVIPSSRKGNLFCTELLSGSFHMRSFLSPLPCTRTWTSVCGMFCFETRFLPVCRTVCVIFDVYENYVSYVKKSIQRSAD